MVDEAIHTSLLHFTDSHFVPRSKSFIPQGRTETYFEDVDYEVEQLRQLCLARNVKAILFSGDFFHLKDSHHFHVRDLIFYSEMVESFGIPFYFIPGNHDLWQSSMDNYRKSALFTLERMTPNMINVMDVVSDFEVHDAQGRPLFPISIGGARYDKLEAAFETHLPGLEERLARSAGYRFALTHTDMLLPGDKPLPGFWDMASYDDVLDVLPSADVVCGGHIHHGSHIYRRMSQAGRPQRVSKPNSFGRVVKDYFATTDDIQLQHRPTCTVFDFHSPIDTDGRISGTIEVDATELEIPHVSFEHAFAPDKIKQILDRAPAMVKLVEQMRSGAALNAQIVDEAVVTADLMFDRYEADVALQDPQTRERAGRIMGRINRYRTSQ